jgi:hypothetical protein
MKNQFFKLITVLFLFILTSCGSSRTNNPGNESIIGTTINVDNLEVAQFDFPKQLRCDDAQVECAKLGNGWRLPTKDELNILYQNRDKIGKFHNYDYWSSSDCVNESQNNPKSTLDFRNGRQLCYGSAVKLWVRAVRSL